MQRSSTIGNFLDNQSKKKWSNPFSKASKDTIRESKSSSTIAVSTVSKNGSITRSQSSINVNSGSPLPSTPAEIKLRNRSSLVISPPMKSATSQKHRSHFGFGSLKVDTATVTDPKELEFYNQLLGTKSAGTIVEEDEEEDSLLEVSPISPMNDSIITPTHENFKIDNIPEKSAQNPVEELSSVLEDYQLFTKRKSLLLGPITPTFPATVMDDVEEGCNLSASNSLPSLSSMDTVESEMSVMNVSHSLWVGILHEDDDAFTKCDALDGFDAETVFDETEHVKFKRVKFTQRGATHRTSLIFA